jgi:hypothetical protein
MTSDISAIAYHWTEAAHVQAIRLDGLHVSTGGMNGHHESEPGVNLTIAGQDPAVWWNPEIWYLFRPVRITVDLTALRADAFGPDLNSLLSEDTIASSDEDFDFDDPTQLPPMRHSA